MEGPSTSFAIRNVRYEGEAGTSRGKDEIIAPIVISDDDDSSECSLVIVETSAGDTTDNISLNESCSEDTDSLQKPKTTYSCSNCKTSFFSNESDLINHLLAV